MAELIIDRENFNDAWAVFIVHTLNEDPSENKILEDKATRG